MSDKKIEPQPFHLSIVDAINTATEDEIVCLAGLIPRVIIPANHDVIKAAWTDRLKLLGYQGIDYGVPAHLDEEKRRCEKEAAAKAELVGTLDLGELKQELESLIEALNPAGEGYGMFSWMVMVQEFMARLHRRIGQALGK